jgi:hypothetical protein
LPPVNKEEVQAGSRALHLQHFVLLLGVSTKCLCEVGAPAIALKIQSRRLTPAPLGHIVT